MPGKQFYIHADLIESLEQEASKNGVSLDDLIKIKLSRSSNTHEQDNLIAAIANLAGRVQNLELILSRYCILTEAELEDLGYVRGAIEVQADRKPEVAKSAENLAQRRSELAQKIRDEVEQYLN